MAGYSFFLRRKRGRCPLLILEKRFCETQDGMVVIGLQITKILSELIRGGMKLLIMENRFYEDSYWITNNGDFFWDEEEKIDSLVELLITAQLILRNKIEENVCETI